MELNSHYEKASVLEINFKVAEETVILRNSVVAPEKICALSIKYNYPVRLSQWLLFCRVELIEVVRKKTTFTLRLLFMYAFLCIRYRCCRGQYVDSLHAIIPQSILPITGIRDIQYHLHQTQLHRTRFDQFKKVDIWSPEFGP